MKAKDLMIGDWIEWICSTDKKYHGVYKVAAVEETWIDFYDEDGHCCSQPYEEIVPIIITPGIIEVNGLEHRPAPEGDVKYGLTSYEDDYTLEFSFRKGWETWCDIHGHLKNYHGNIRYVHELQHALRLCGIEKEVEL